MVNVQYVNLQAGKKKVYMLFDTEPDTKVTGDLFYSDQQEFDVEFTEMMMKITLDYLADKFREAQKNSQDLGPLVFRDKTFATTQEVQTRLQSLGLFTVIYFHFFILYVQSVPETKLIGLNIKHCMCRLGLLSPLAALSRLIWQYGSRM
jgi:hypothetical protein